MTPLANNHTALMREVYWEESGEFEVLTHDGCVMYPDTNAYLRHHFIPTTIILGSP